MLGNDSELRHAFPTLTPEQAATGPALPDAEETQQALRQLQALFAHTCRARESAGEDAALGEPVAFITNGKQGGFIVTGQAILALKGHDVKAVNDLGAGDGSAGTFIAMLHMGASYKHAGMAAMRMGSEIVQEESARLPDPVARMTQISPTVTRVISDKMKRGDSSHSPSGTIAGRS